MTGGSPTSNLLHLPWEAVRTRRPRGVFGARPAGARPAYRAESKLNIRPLSAKSADGQSGGETPGPIPNPAVKPAGVPRGTEVREPTGNAESCQPPFPLGVP